MNHITLNDEQSRMVAQSPEPLEVLDPAGECMGYVVRRPSPKESRVTDEDIAVCKERMAKKPRKPGMTTEQLVEHLNTLRRP